MAPYLCRFEELMQAFTDRLLDFLDNWEAEVARAGRFRSRVLNVLELWPRLYVRPNQQLGSGTRTRVWRRLQILTESREKLSEESLSAAGGRFFEWTVA